MNGFFTKTKNAYLLALLAIVVFVGCFLFRCCLNVALVKYRTQLARHGQLDRLTETECRFVKKQKQSNVSYFKNNLNHLRELDGKLKKVIFRHKELEKTMVSEWAAVKEQSMLLEQASLKEGEQFLVFGICEELSKCIADIDELTDRQQSILLYWENVKNERMKQKEKVLKKLNNIATVSNCVPGNLNLTQNNDNTDKTDKNL